MKRLLIILGGIFENNKIASKLRDLEKILLEKNFWKDKLKVKKTVKEKKIYEDILSSHELSSKEVTNLKDFYNLALEEKDDELLQDCNSKIPIKMVTNDEDTKL